jgi:hypothetical protein
LSSCALTIYGRYGVLYFFFLVGCFENIPRVRFGNKNSIHSNSPEKDEEEEEVDVGGEEEAQSGGTTIPFFKSLFLYTEKEEKDLLLIFPSPSFRRRQWG